jgi:hypothetical protein
MKKITRENFEENLIKLERYFEVESGIISESMRFLETSDLHKKHLLLFKLILTYTSSLLTKGKTSSEDEKTLQLIGVRVFNDGISAFRMAIAGYYQISISIQRDLLEAQFLADLFRTHPEEIEQWRNTTNQERVSKYSASNLYKKLDQRDNFLDGKRKARYQQFCEYASHISYPGFKLIVDKEGLIQLGPFYDEKKLGDTIVELNRTFGHAMMTLSSMLKTSNLETIQISMILMEEFGSIFDIEIIHNESFVSAKELILKYYDSIDE